MKVKELKLEEIEASHTLGGPDIAKASRGRGGVQGIGKCTKFYYEQQTKPELKGIHICGCRYDERLKCKTDGSRILA